MRGEDLDVAPREADQVRPSSLGELSDRLRPALQRDLREIQNVLAKIRAAFMDVVSEIRAADRIDLLAGQEDIQDALHVTSFYSKVDRDDAAAKIAILDPAETGELHGLRQSFLIRKGSD